MLMLVFQLGEDRFAVDTSCIVEIVPSLALRKLPHAPGCVAGIFNYRGTVVPVIDLCRLTQGRDCRDCLSTRIIVTRARSENGSKRLVGLRAERVTETRNVAQVELVSQGMQVAEAPYLGEIIKDKQGMIQCIRMEHLLPKTLTDLIFQEVTEQA